MPTETSDDALTLAALGVLAFILADVTHEALGHGLATLAVGEKPILLTTCYFTSQGSYSRWIPAGGGLANVCAGLLSLLLLRIRQYSPLLCYFLILIASFNLLFATAYPFYSGIAMFGDWAAVISGMEPAWLWRALLIFASVAGYTLSLVLVAHAIRPFCGSRDPQALHRLRRITLIPFLAAMAAALLGGIPNPRGWTMILSAAVPAAAASFGLTQMDHFSIATSSQPQVSTAGAIQRSRAWILPGLGALILFVAVLGPGIHFQ